MILKQLLSRSDDDHARGPRVAAAKKYTTQDLCDIEELILPPMRGRWHAYLLVLSDPNITSDMRFVGHAIAQFNATSPKAINRNCAAVAVLRRNTGESALMPRRRAVLADLSSEPIRV